MGLREDLAANVLAFVQYERPFGPRESSGVSRLTSRGVALGNAQRALGKISGAVTLTTLEQVAAKLGLQPWQLLVPKMAPSDLPVAVPASQLGGRSRLYRSSVSPL